MDKDNRDLWQEIINDLLGSCSSISTVLSRYDAEELEDYQPFLEELDQQIFLCDACGWWCPVSEAETHEDYGQDICTDCLDLMES